MTRQETESLLRYMMCMYPNVKMSEQQFNSLVTIWAAEFENDSCDSVGAGLRIARLESPKWMPNLPEIRNAMRSISARICQKSEEQEFKDSHCGRTKQEWESFEKWEQSEERNEKIDSYRNRLSKVFGTAV